MIDNAWKWAAENGKLEKNTVNQAEYAYLVVDVEREKTTEDASSLTMKSCSTFQDILCYSYIYTHAWPILVPFKCLDLFSEVFVADPLV